MIVLRDHNERPVTEILRVFETSSSVIYVSGVGTGKSFVFMGAAERMGARRIAYIIPKLVIKNNMEAYEDFSRLSADVDFLTYNYFTDLAKAAETLAGYDLVVIDECHHLGSDRYGRCIVSAMRSLSGGTKFLGLTATPKRERGDDVTGYFDARVDGISNFEAIEQGLMPPIDYRVCLPEQDLKQIEREYEGSVKAKLSFTDSEKVLKSAAAMFPRDKWICFFPNVEVLHAHEELVRAMFPGHKMLTLYAELGNLDSVVEELKGAGKAVVLSCNILLEGVHLPGIDGIVLFRNVTSLPCFQQMVGRVCSIGKDISPVVLDCSSSALKLMAKLLSSGRGVSAETGSEKTSEKDVVRIGIGEHRNYDISSLLRLIDPASGKEENADNAIEKYKSFNGNTTYKTLEELKENELDFRKFKACCRLYGTTIDFALKRMTI